MSNDCDTSEITPLRSRTNDNNSNYCFINNNYNNSNNINNNNNNNNNCDSTNTTNSSEYNSTMDDTRRIIFKIVIDFIILLCVGIPILLFFLLGEPYNRGFFCNDQSLMHPFHESTVRNWMLYVIGLVFPIGLMLATEIIHSKLHARNTGKKLRIGEWNVPPWVLNAYKQIGVFGFGAACSQLTTDIAKYSIGRLRPHFHSVCQPIMPDGSDCTNPINLYRYIEEFTCLGLGSDQRMLKEMRLSFPSGHASFSAYTMIYSAIYLHARMTWKGSKLIKHFLQFGMISLTWFTSLSRISDYKHHWSDVLAGGTLGIICAILVSQFVSNLFVKKSEPLLQQQNQPRYELSTPSSNGDVV